MRRIEGAEDVARGVAALVAADPRLAPLAERVGTVPLRRDVPGFAGLARIVVGQMISRESAEAIWKRLVAHTDPPTAAAFLHLGSSAHRAIGLSGAKERTLVHLAATVESGALDLAGLCALPGERAIAELTELPGIGRWTAEVYLLFCAGHPDIFPTGDVALQNAVRYAFALDTRPSAGVLAGIAQAWSPWRGVAARLFWAYYSLEIRRNVLPIV
ncbi:DNA-3-methyladenine glycosylase family protein [Pararhizobium mangrovi]|uniref:DNA-3-methyladenine glycosylase II n=1 Tax=Pararhizobium mangrovi TaxID=2590452 RepID=A0A506TV79_9HYPH|nr:DNA-3-methyladenine glycosylase [Pararhizobium mangrovi]TPW25973.1 DNA-3-methyladenine glycosylase 2 family protein [Pararhizobium mangrovi]